MRLTYRQRALGDLDDIFQYLQKRNPVGARNVLRAINGAIRAIAELPEASERTSNPHIRVRLVAEYRYKIFYRIVDADTIRIIHIRHASRRPWAPED
jgi:toxin ParE1/3/4